MQTEENCYKTRLSLVIAAIIHISFYEHDDFSFISCEDSFMTKHWRKTEDNKKGLTSS